MKQGCEMKNEKIKQKLLQQKQRIKAQNNVLMKIIGEIKNPKPTIEIKRKKGKNQRRKK